MLRETGWAAVMTCTLRDRHVSSATMALSSANGPGFLIG